MNPPNNLNSADVEASRVRVLYVEDEESNHGLVRFSLKRARIDVELVITKTVEEARKMIQQGVDLVISDRNLGEENIPENTSGVDVINSALEAGISTENVVGFSTNLEEYIPEIGNSNIRVIEKLGNTQELVRWVEERVRSLANPEQRREPGMKLISESIKGGITVREWEITRSSSSEVALHA